MRLKTLFREYNYPTNLVSGVKNSYTLSGSGTKFTEYLVPGASIEVELTPGVTTLIGKVASIQSNTSLTLDTPIDATFANKPFWIDWSFYLISSSRVNRRIESENPGEAGVIVFDDVTLDYFYTETLNIAGTEYYNPVWKAFQGDHDAKNIFLIRRVAVSDQGAATTFEGMVNFKTIKYPDVYSDETGEFTLSISFQVKDKLSALSLMDKATARTEASLKDRILLQAPAATFVHFNNIAAASNEYWIQPGHPEIYDSLSNPVLSPGEYLLDPAGSGEYFLITESVIAAHPNYPGYTFNKITFFPASSDHSFCIHEFEDDATKYLSKEYYGVDINIVSGGVLQGFDALKILSAFVTRGWQDITIINNLIDINGDPITEFQIPYNYCDQLIDENPFDKEPLEALIYLANSLFMYIFFDRLGRLVLQKKNRHAAAGGDKTIPLEYISSQVKNEVWDKIADAVTVTVLSCVFDESAGEFLVGEATYKKKANTKPRNELNIELILDATTLSSYGMSIDANGKLVDPELPGTGITEIENQQLILDKYAGLRAVEFFGYYGTRHESYEISLNKIDLAIAQWEMLNTFDHNNGRYFITGLDFHEEESLSTELVSLDGADYSIKKVAIPQRDDSYTAGRGSSLSRTGDTNNILIQNMGENQFVQNFAQLKTALKSPLASDLKISVSKSFNITEKLEINLNGYNLELIGHPGVKLKSTVTSGLFSHLVPDGAVVISGGKDVKLVDIEYEFTNPGSYTFAQQDSRTQYLEGILIEDCERVILDNVKANKAAHSGIRVLRCNKASALECEAKNNLYAGLEISETKYIRVWGGEYSYNGSDCPSNGYGVMLSGRWGSNPDIDNADVKIDGVTANYNYRKGIDVHGGVNVRVIYCKVTGFGYGGIYAVNEPGEEHYSGFVKDVYIAFNQIKQDATWYAARTLNAQNVGVHPIQTGNYYNVEATGAGGWYGGGPGGTVKVYKNLIDLCDSINGGTNWLKYPISHFGGAMDDLTIENNTIKNCSCVHGIYITGNDFGRPKEVGIKNNHFINVDANVIPPGDWDNSNSLIFVLNGEEITVKNNPCIDSSALHSYCAIYPYGNGAHIGSVDIGNTQVNGTFAYGVFLNRVGASGEFGIDTACIHDMEFKGTYSSGLYWYINPSIKYTTNNNRALLGIDPADGSSISLPNYTSAQSGNVEYDIQTGGVAPKSVNTLTVDASAYSGGTIAFEVKIVAVGANLGLSAVYTFDAVAGNDGGAAPSFQVLEPRRKGLIGTASENIPTLAWSPGSGNTRTLVVTIPQTFRGCFMKIEFSGWRLSPYQKSN